MIINRPGLQFRIIVVLSIWTAFVSYGIIATFLNDYWIQQWASNNAIPLSVTIFTLCFCSLFILIGFRSSHVKAVKKKNEKQEKEAKKEKNKRQIREI